MPMRKVREWGNEGLMHSPLNRTAKPIKGQKKQKKRKKQSKTKNRKRKTPTKEKEKKKKKKALYFQQLYFLEWYAVREMAQKDDDASKRMQRMVREKISGEKIFDELMGIN